MRRQGSANKLTCFCSRKPLLAIYGNDEDGRPYVHIRIYKQGRIYGDVVVHGGEVKLCCRECLRWHVINFVDEQNTQAELVETNIPVELDRQPVLVQAVPNEG